VNIVTLVIYIVFPGGRYPHNIISTLINTLSLGIIPILLQSRGEEVRTARKEELKAEILAIENQELIENFAQKYNKQSPAQPNDVTQSSNPEDYVSPYQTN
jgi:hypothetical protein